MTRRAARFLTSLYPPAWRARFGAEFQTFLESREVSLLEAIDIAGRAAFERISEGWRAALLATTFVCTPMFAGFCAVYLGAGGHAIHSALWLCWGAIEAAAITACLAMMGPLGPAIRGALGSRRLMGQAAFTLLAGAVLLYYGFGWHMAAGLAMLWTGNLWQSVAGRWADERLSFLLAASIVTATLDSLGWGLFYRGDFVIDLWLFASLALFEVIKTTKSARRIFAGQWAGH